MVTTRELELTDGRRLVVHDAGGPRTSDAFTLVWHHGSPQTGALLDPLVAAAAARDIRLVSYARPSYGGSSPFRGRDIASAAGDVARVADALGIDRFAVMGASGGGPHGLACAALLPGRVIGAVSLAGPAPYTDSFDWYAGMVSPGGLRAARAGRAERERFALTDEFDEDSFTAADWAALEGAWVSLGRDAGRAGAAWPEGLIDDDLAIAGPWGFDVAAIDVPVLLIQGGEDRVIPPTHAEALMRAIPTSELWLRPRDGHVSVLDACPVAMDWLRHARGVGRAQGGRRPYPRGGLHRAEERPMTDDATRIGTLIERWAEAVHVGDLEGVVADHADDIVMFDVPPPSDGVRGIDAYRETWPPFFEWQAQGASFEIVALEVTAGEDVAFAHALLRCGTPAELESDPENRLRLTVGLRKEGGRWVVAHEHHSFPAKD